MVRNADGEVLIKGEISIIKKKHRVIKDRHFCCLLDKRKSGDVFKTSPLFLQKVFRTRLLFLVEQVASSSGLYGERHSFCE